MRGRLGFVAVRVVGGLVPSGLLERVGAQDSSLERVQPSDYYLAAGERLGEAITRSWNRLRTLWERFSERIEEEGALTGPTRQEWLLPLFQELGFDQLDVSPGLELEGKPYPISHLWQSIPIHLVGVGVDLERRSPRVVGAASASPHGLVQEFLNRSEDHLWGVVSNGRQLRLLRDNASLTRTAYVEFDLRETFEGEVYSDFALLWLICHASRLEGRAGKQVLEQWREESARQGVRALNDLRAGVETAIETLGSAAIAHPDNIQLRQRLEEGTLDAQELYRQLLRVVYRFLFLLVSESRGLLLDPTAEPEARAHYRLHYSITRIRELAESTRGGPHGDLWQQHRLIARILEARGEPSLGLPALGGFLWSQEATAELDDLTIPNKALLDAIRALTTIRPPGGVIQRVDYANLGAEELGSIYEALLEYLPQINLVGGTFQLETAAGNERKTTGSYYTPTSLINELLNSALDPVLEEAATADDPETAILNLKVVDPAAGSGHFLIAAANRIADRLARVRTSGNEPSPEQLRTALRDVIGHCIHAVDVNPMAVELAKVALWIEAMESGKPLTFLDHHIVCGNSLLGVTPKLLEEGIPDGAYVALTGDDKQQVKTLKARNRQERKKGLVALPFGDTPEDTLQHAAEELDAIDALDDNSIASIQQKQERLQQLVAATDQRRLRLAADAWTSAFMTPKTNDAAQITTATVNAALHDPDTLPQQLTNTISQLAQQHRFHHWHLTFPHIFTPTRGTTNPQTGWPGGFDVVLGNPPWERVKLQEKEFFARSAPEIAKAPDKASRSRLLRFLQVESPGLWQEFQNAVHDAESTSQFLRTSGVYPLCGRGDVNTYSVFAEAMRQIVGSSGRVGVIVPTGIATDDTTKHFFASLVDLRSLVSLFDFENRKGIFTEVHRGQKFCLLTLAGTARRVDESEFVFFAVDTTDLDDPERRFILTPEDFSLLNPNSRNCPVFRTRRDAELTKRIYRRCHVLIHEAVDSGNPWGAQFLTMFHMSGDSDLFRTRTQLESTGWTLFGNVYSNGTSRFLPLYEAKMTGLFDHRAADIIISQTAQIRQGQPESLSDSAHIDPERLAMPRYWVDEKEVRSRIPWHWAVEWLIGFRNVTSPTNERTMVPGPLPLVGVGHSFPLIFTREAEQAVSLLAMLSSFVLDYIARQKIGGINMTYNFVEQLAVLRPSEFRAAASWDGSQTVDEWLRPRIEELVATAADLAIFGREPEETRAFRWDRTRREILRAELDGAFFHLYRIERPDVDYIMDTFSIVKRKDMAEHGLYRTKELILAVYDRMSNAIDTGEPYQTILDPPPAHPSLCLNPGSTP